jgi:NAD(P)-dependent dehydrogenase (short-subunit alcohol dehydrogenase family)|tara:strand:+ start:1509 stop:2222 length:714 start_codon:yes stop_codon:yes gene_type:complete
MKNKVILITGANKGIGKTLSLEFSKMGVNIVLLGRNEESLDSVYDEIITTTSTKPLIIKCDLSDIDNKSAKQINDEIMGVYGRLDGVIFNAAKLGKMSTIEDYEEDIWKEVFNINLHSAFIISKEILPALKAAPNGRIIFTSSGVAEVGKAFWGAYSASKFAVKGLAEILRDELDTTSNVKVFNYDPGKTRTSMRALAYPAENPQDLKEPKVLFNDYLWFFSDESQLSNQHYFKFDN